MAQPLLDLKNAIAGIRTEDAATGFDRCVGALIQAISPFLAETQAIVPVQRALLSLPGRRDPQIGLEKLSETLAAVDAELGPQMGGFSRLLENALHAGELNEVVRLQPDWVDEALRPLAHQLAATARALDALDDFAHALSVRSEWPAGAIALGCLRSLLPPELQNEVADEWMSTRGIAAQLSELLQFRGSVSDLAPSDVEKIHQKGLSQAMALWLLACRVAEGANLERAGDRACIDVLLEKAELVPLEVFDVAGLWPELMGD